MTAAVRADIVKGRLGILRLLLLRTTNGDSRILGTDGDPTRERLWLTAIESGEHTTDSLAAMTGLSSRTIRRGVANARRFRPEPSSSDSPETPRLELRLSPNPRQCNHSRTLRLPPPEPEADGDVDPPAPGPIECLDCDSTSTDGGETWVPSGPNSPRLSVIVPHGHGSRRGRKELRLLREGQPGRSERIEPRPWQLPPDPPGPTSYEPESKPRPWDEAKARRLLAKYEREEAAAVARTMRTKGRLIRKPT